MRFSGVLSIFAVVLASSAGSAFADDQFSTLADVATQPLSVQEMGAVVGASGGLRAFPPTSLPGDADNGAAINDYVNNQGTNIADTKASYHASNPGKTSLGD